MSTPERNEGMEKGHVEFINRLSWAELLNHLTSDGGHAMDFDRINRGEVHSRRNRAEVTHRELHSHAANQEGS